MSIKCAQHPVVVTCPTWAAAEIAMWLSGLIRWAHRAFRACFRTFPVAVQGHDASDWPA
jgi:hypothetical protein